MGKQNILLTKIVIGFGNLIKTVYLRVGKTKYKQRKQNATDFFGGVDF